MNPLWPFLLPELRRIPRENRVRALAQAREQPLDAVELTGMAVALVLVTALTRWLIDPSTLAAQYGSALLSFAVALPMLALTLGPFHLRRLRRGLRRQLRDHARSP